jgi:hypothetical protein
METSMEEEQEQEQEQEEQEEEETSMEPCYRGGRCRWVRRMRSR